MSINKIKSRLKESSKRDNTWIEKAKHRRDNKAWLDISFAIAVKIMSALKANKIHDVYPKNQKELALALNCSPQYVNKLLKGTENLQLETITKIENILNIGLIQVQEFQTNFQVNFEEYSTYNQSDELINTDTILSNYEELLMSFSFENDPECNLKLVA